MKFSSYEYSFDEHKHRFALWTASRAINRDFCSTKALAQMTKEIEFQSLINQVKNENFESWFYSTCNKVLDYFNDNSLSFKHPSFGRAAKFVSIYLKSYYVIDSSENEKLREVIFPPIDRILLQNIILELRKTKSHSDVIPKLKIINWTTLSMQDYKELKLLIEKLDLTFNWSLERFWKMDNK